MSNSEKIRELASEIKTVELKDISYDSLAEVILSMAHIDKENFLSYKLISINFNIDFIAHANGALYHKNEKYTDNDVIKEILIDRLKSALKDDPSNLEFVRVDGVTKTVMVVTKPLIDLVKDPSSGVKVGRLMVNYHKMWMQTKCLSDPSKISPELVSKMFSKTELRIIDDNYIPIFIAPDGMDVFKRVMDDVVTVSPISDYIQVSRGFNVYGKAENTKMWWVPRSVAQGYLQEEDLLKVKSERLLRTMLVESNLFEDESIPKLGTARAPMPELLSKELVNIKTDIYLKSQILMPAKESVNVLPAAELIVQDTPKAKGPSLDQRMMNILGTTISEDIHTDDKAALKDDNNLSELAVEQN